MLAMTMDAFGTGIGGPGMWDPMPLPPPVTPQEPREEEKLIWSRPENITPEPAAPKKPSKRRPAAKKKAKKPAKKRAAKKAAKKKRPVKKSARKKKR